MFIIGHASKYSRAGNKPALVLPGPPERAPVNMSWVCSECTFYNVNADFLVCEICLNRRVPPGFRDHAVTRSGSTWSYAAPLLEVVDNFGIPYGTVELQGSSGHVRNFGRNVSALLLWGIDSGKVKTVKIPDTVRIIGQAAFRLCAALVSVEIPSSVDTIGVWAFEGCIALEAVHFPEVSNIKCIPRDCFSGCSALRKVTIPSYIEEIGLAAFAGCDSLATVTLPLASMKRRSAIGALAFGRHHSGSGQLGPVLDLGIVSNTDEPNIHQAILHLHRYATMLHKLPKGAGHCMVQRQWPSSASNAPTDPGPATLVDGSGIVQPLQLQTLAGDEYMVHGCCGKAPVAHPDFKRLAAEQHPEALGVVDSWDVLLHNTDVATHTLDLAAVGNMLVRGEFDLEEPVLVVWTEPEQPSERAPAGAAEPTGLPAPKRPRCTP